MKKYWKRMKKKPEQLLSEQKKKVTMNKKIKKN